MSTVEDSYLVGLIGDGVIPSLTPPMHEREADAQGLRYLYRPIDLKKLGRPGADVGVLLKSGAELGFNAFNITHPCKQLVLEHLDEISEHAQRIGAVNTVVISQGKFIGHNTDATGFGRALKTGLPQAVLSCVLQLGAGGAGAAVSQALLHAGAQRLIISEPDEQRAAQQVQHLHEHFPQAQIEAVDPIDAPQLLAEATGLVNASPIGMHHHPGLPIDLTHLTAEQWVSDCIYRPVDTELIRTARERGCQVLDGGHMAVGQAVDAFRIFTGIAPDAARMRAHLLEMLEVGL